MQAPKLGGPVRWTVREDLLLGTLDELVRELTALAREIPEDAVSSSAAAAWGRAWGHLATVRQAIAESGAERAAGAD